MTHAGVKNGWPKLLAGWVERSNIVRRELIVIIREGVLIRDGG